MTLKRLLLVGCGGGLGAMVRYGITLILDPVLGTTFPWSILTVNVLAGLLMGIATGAMIQRLKISPEADLFLTVGCLGGLSAFSSFCYDSANLLYTRDIIIAVLSIGLSMVLAIAAVAVGQRMTRGRKSV